jgi:hypothetical protein
MNSSQLEGVLGIERGIYAEKCQCPLLLKDERQFCFLGDPIGMPTSAVYIPAIRTLQRGYTRGK